MRTYASILTLALLLSVGCDKIKRLRETPPPPPAAPALPVPAVTTEGPPAVGPDEWSQVGEVRVRLDGFSVMVPTVVGLGVRESEWRPDEEYAVIALSIENMSKTRKLDYHRWEFSTGKMTDEHGNKYSMRLTTVSGKVKGGTNGYATVHPGEAPITEVLAFERPVAAATTFTLTLKPLTDAEGKHVFRFGRPK